MTRFFKNAAAVTTVLVASVTASAEVRFITSTGAWASQNTSTPTANPEYFQVQQASGTPVAHTAKVTELNSHWGPALTYAVEGPFGYRYGYTNWVSFANNSGNYYGSFTYTLPVVNSTSIGQTTYTMKFHLPTGQPTQNPRLIIMGADEVAQVKIQSVQNGMFVFATYRFLNGATYTSGCKDTMIGCTWDTRLDTDKMTIPATAFGPGDNILTFTINRKNADNGPTGTGFGLNYLLVMPGLTATGTCPVGKYCGDVGGDNSFVNIGFAPR